MTPFHRRSGEMRGRIPDEALLRRRQIVSRNTEEEEGTIREEERHGIIETECEKVMEKETQGCRRGGGGGALVEARFSGVGAF